MSQFKYFDFHLQVLNSVLSLLKIERSKLQHKLKHEIYSDVDRTIESIVKMPLISEDISKLLKNYFLLKPKDSVKSSMISDQSQMANFGQ